MTLNLVLFGVGLLMLYYGAGTLVRGSSSLAQSLRLNPLVIGLTVVAFGTSAPEMVVSVLSSLKGKGMIAVGNVIGSNICNISLVLGVASLIHPIHSHRSVIRPNFTANQGIPQRRTDIRGNECRTHASRTLCENRGRRWT